MSNTSKEETNALLKETLRIAWPAVLESFFISLAGMIDTLMVSSLGTYAVAATGLTTQPKFITLSFFFAINVSLSALVARRLGEKNRKSANEILLTALILSVILCAVLSVVSVALADPIIKICGSAEDTHGPAVTYFRVIQGGMFFNVMSMAINAAQRGSGNTRIAMTTNIVSSLVNICFNYLLINGHLGFPRWELFGAAFATVLGTIAAFFMSLRSLFKKDSYVSIPYMRQEHIRPSKEALKSLVTLSTNMLLENMAMRVGFVVTAIQAAKLGTDAFAAHQVGMNFLSLSFSFGDGMQTAAVALIGRSLGERNPELAKRYGHICQRVGLAISVVLCVIYIFGGRGLFSLFFDDPEVLSMGVLIARYITLICIFQISQIIYAGCLRGAGDVRYCLYVSLLSVTAIRSIVTWLLTSVIPLGLSGIWLGVFSDQFSRYILLRHRFQQGDWVYLKI